MQVRNERGRELLESVGPRLETTPTVSTGDRRQLVLQTALADDTAKLGEAPDPMPVWLGNILAWVVEKVRPPPQTCPAGKNEAPQLPNQSLSQCMRLCWNIVSFGYVQTHVSA